eukprot:Rmarinus@m.14891
MDQEVLIILATGILAVVIAALFLKFSKRKHVKDTVLLLGPTGSGKTRAFLLLKSGSFGETHTSLKPNDLKFSIHEKCCVDGSPSKEIRFVDFPGLPRLRSKLSSYLQQASCIVFFVDSAELSGNIEPTASYLFDVLTDASVAESQTPLLVACNKSDLPLALGPSLIRSRLETELTRLRETRGAAPDEAGDEQTQEKVFLGYDGEKFSFDHSPCPVTFAPCSLHKTSVEPILEFIAANGPL